MTGSRRNTSKAIVCLMSPGLENCLWKPGWPGSLSMSQCTTRGVRSSSPDHDFQSQCLTTRSLTSDHVVSSDGAALSPELVTRAWPGPPLRLAAAVEVTQLKPGLLTLAIQGTKVEFGDGKMIPDSTDMRTLTCLVSHLSVM